MFIFHTDNDSTEYQLFTEYYSKLVDTLPANVLSHHFVSGKIISLTDHERIMKSNVSQDAAILLLNKVSLQLQSGNTTALKRMLLIMDHHGIDASRAISLEMQSKLSLFECEDSVVCNSGQSTYVAMNIYWYLALKY